MATATLAEIYFQQGLLDKAVEIYQKVLRHHPDDQKSRERLAALRAMRSSGRAQDADDAEETTLEEEVSGESPPETEPEKPSFGDISETTEPEKPAKEGQ
jgi:hypothetical protein